MPIRPRRPAAGDTEEPSGHGLGHGLMCGRFVQAQPRDVLAELLDAEEIIGPELPARYNVAPTDQVYALVASREGRRRLGTMRWGLVPFWKKDPTRDPRPINAKAETVATRPMFAEAFARRRCLIPADGFYEWQKSPDGGKQPYFLSDPDGAPLVLAGLWANWHGEDGERLSTCAVITTEASPHVARLHDRMPALLGPEEWDEWLTAGPGQSDHLARLLQPAKGGALALRPVSRRVNSVRHDDADLLAPLGAHGPRPGRVGRFQLRTGPPPDGPASE